MKIPIIDKLVDKQFESKPKKTKFVATFPLTIKKGEKSGTVDIPCTMDIGNFTLSFPSGITYIYGDDEKKEESKKARFRSCPAITIALPEIADKDTTVPLQIGLTRNPKTNSLHEKFDAFQLPIVLIGLAVYIALSNLPILNPLSITQLLFLALTLALIGFMTLWQTRTIQRSLRFWKTVDIKKEVKEE